MVATMSRKFQDSRSSVLYFAGRTKTTLANAYIKKLCALMRDFACETRMDEDRISVLISLSLLSQLLSVTCYD